MRTEEDYIELDDDDTGGSDDQGQDAEDSNNNKKKIKLREVLALDLLYQEDDNSVDLELAEPTFNWEEFCRDEMAILLAYHQIKLPKDFRADGIPAEAVELFEELALMENRYDLKVPTRAMLRLCLKKVLYYRYKLDFEIDGAPKKYSQINGKGIAESPSVWDQKVRNETLKDVQLKALSDQGLRMEILDLAEMSLLLKMLPEMFRREGAREVTAEQMNDLTVNFLFWTLNNCRAFDRRHQLLIYFTLFKCSDQKETYLRMKELLGGDDFAEFKNLYEEIELIFNEQGKEMLESFLKEADFASGLKIAAADAFEDKRFNKSEGVWIKPKIDLPAGPIENELRNIDALLARYGNFTARNNFIVTILPFIFKFSASFTKGRAKIMDAYHDAIFQCLNKVVKFDVRLGYSPTTYFYNWIRNSVTRTAWRNRDVAIPFEISASVADKIERGFLSLAKDVRIDEPLDADNVNSDLRGDRLKELRTNEFSGKVLEKNLMEKMDEALSILPRFDGEILRRRCGIGVDLDEEGETLDKIGATVGVSRERVRHWECTMLHALRTGKLKVEGYNSGIYRLPNLVYEVNDEEKFYRWSQRAGLSRRHANWLFWHFSGSSKNLYKQMSAKDIHRYMIEKGVKDVPGVKVISDFLMVWGRKIKAKVDEGDPEFDFITLIRRAERYQQVRATLSRFGYLFNERRSMDEKSKSNKVDQIESLIVSEEKLEEIKLLVEKYKIPKIKIYNFYEKIQKLVDSLDPPQLAMVLRWGLVKGEPAEIIADKLGIGLVDVYVLLGTAEIYVLDVVAGLN